MSSLCTTWDLNQLAELDDEEMVDWACRYVVNLTDEETWKTARAYGSGKGTWEMFKKEILRMYPGNEGRKYTRCDLKELVQKQSRKAGLRPRRL